MIDIDGKIVSLDIFQVMFACDYKACKGACCVEGEGGAPLDEGEADKLRAYLPKVRHLLSPRALEVIEKDGVSYIDEDGDELTSIVDGRDCIFTTYDEEGNCQCAYEKMYYAGEIDWIKPLSCQLYPIRLTKYPGFTAVNYHEWNICRCARKRGKSEGVRVYQFLKQPLIRAFGAGWYRELEAVARELEEHPKHLEELGYN